MPLGQLAKLEYSTGPAQISREQIRRVVVEANVGGRDLGGFVREARARVAREVKLDPGYYLEWVVSLKTWRGPLLASCWWFPLATES